MKNCKNCNGELDFSYCWDDPTLGYAFNLYTCFSCGSIYKVNVWKDAGALEITLEGVVRRLPNED